MYINIYILYIIYYKNSVVTSQLFCLCADCFVSFLPFFFPPLCFWFLLSFCTFTALSLSL